MHVSLWNSQVHQVFPAKSEFILGAVRLFHFKGQNGANPLLAFQIVDGVLITHQTRHTQVQTAKGATILEAPTRKLREKAFT